MEDAIKNARIASRYAMLMAEYHEVRAYPVPEERRQSKIDRLNEILREMRRIEANTPMTHSSHSWYERAKAWINDKMTNG